jgi:hypothetical protein
MLVVVLARFTQSEVRLKINNVNSRPNRIRLKQSMVNDE